MQNWQRMAADRLTQLQDAVNLQAENFCNSIGILQMYAKESTFVEFNSINKQQLNNNGENDTTTKDKTINLPNSSSSSSSSSSSKSITNGSPSSSSSKENQCKNSSTNNKPNDYENSQLFARLIARTAKDIDTLIESLPNTFESEQGSSDLHLNSIRQLEYDNSRCIVELETVIKRGERLLDIIHKALDEIAIMQLKSQTLDNNNVFNK